MKVLLLLLSLAVAVQARSYTVTVATSDMKDAGTDDDIFLTLVGEEGMSSAHLLDIEWFDDFEKNSNDTYSVEVNPEIGPLAWIRFSTPDPDAWKPVSAIVRPEGGRNYYFYNTHVTWVSGEESDGGVAQLDMHEQGRETYYVTFTTAGDWLAGADYLYPTLRIIGEMGYTDTGLLDVTNHNDWERGKEDLYTVRGMKYVGNIECIKLEVRGDDAWKFSSIEVHSDSNTNPRVFSNDDGVWMSSDENEGSRSEVFC